MWSITSERLAAFRAKLREEMLGNPGPWYCPNKKKNADVLLRNHPECPYKISKSGIVAEHRYVWWLHHPDKLIEYNEIIHHINGDHQDNRIENLEKIKMKQHQLPHKELRQKNGDISIFAIQNDEEKDGRKQD